MRHADERRVHLDKALEFRRELHTSRNGEALALQTRRYGA